MIEIILLMAAVLFLGGATFFALESKEHLQSKLSAIILTIAGGSYLWMSHLYGLDSEVNLRVWRYLDWLFTVPILIYQMYLYLDNKGKKASSLVISILCMLGMLAFGFTGEAGIIPKFFGGFLGTMFAIYTFVALSNGISGEKTKFYASVLGLWMFYPVVYFFTDNILTIGLYALVDLTAKLGMAVYIYGKNRKENGIK